MAKDAHIPSLDGLRGCAVLSLLLLHLGGGAQSHQPVLRVFGAITRYGWAGVTLFFVLSGFLITGILWDSKGSPHWWRNFFMRRALRIFPLYYASLLLALIASVLLGYSWRNIRSLWIFALYLQTFPSVGRQWPVALHLGHFWSLAVEEQFYLVWPWILLHLRTRRQGQFACIIVILLSAVANVTFALNRGHWLHVPFFGNMGAPAAGCLIAFSFGAPEWKPGVLRWAPAAAVFGLICFMGIDHVSEPLDFSVGLIFLWVTCAGLLMLALRPGRFSRLMSTPWIRWLAPSVMGFMCTTFS